MKGEKKMSDLNIKKALYDMENINEHWLQMFQGNFPDKKKDEIENCLFNYFVDYNSTVRGQIVTLFFSQDVEEVDQTFRKLVYHGKGKITNFFPTPKLSQRIWKKYGENPKYNITEFQENEERKDRGNELKKRIEKMLRGEY